VTGQMEVGTHTLFAGELVDAGVLQGGEPMTYAYYHTIKRGTTPRNAPTFVAEKKEEKPAMAKYECSVCGYVYDPEAGDPDGKIPPGTPFENLPDSWVCPVCGAAKSEFKKLG